MSVVRTHDELRDLLPAAALEILDGSEHGPVLAHVAGCPECTRVLTDYREVVAAMSLLLPERGMDPERHDAIRARLLARVREGTAPDRARGSVTSQRRVLAHFAGRWGGWAVAAGLGGVLLLHHAVHRPVDYGWLVAGVLSVVVVVLAVFAVFQYRRAKVLRHRLTLLSDETLGEEVEAGRPGQGTTT